MMSSATFRINKLIASVDDDIINKFYKIQACQSKTVYYHIASDKKCCLDNEVINTCLFDVIRLFITIDCLIVEHNK
jgi:hypothetical protein